MTLTDTHCHLYMDRFQADLPAVMARAAAAGVRRVLVPGLEAGTSERASQLAVEHEIIYCAVGFHPTEADTLNEPRLHHLKHMATAPKVVAIGEIGLDYYWVTDADQRRRQYTALHEQLTLAQELKLPVVLHLREQEDAESGTAALDLLAILRQWSSGLQRSAPSLRGQAGVLHSFSGSAETAAEAISLGFYIGVTGPITFPTADRRRAVVATLPLERLLIETDAPFLAPQQHRGKRNEPAFVSHIADKIADIQSRTPAEVIKTTSSNAARLFGWEEPD